MCRKSGNHWVECRDPIDLMNYPSNLEIGLCSYWKEPPISGLII